jgi:hypothetical protein
MLSEGTEDSSGNDVCQNLMFRSRPYGRITSTSIFNAQRDILQLFIKRLINEELT